MQPAAAQVSNTESLAAAVEAAAAFLNSKSKAVLVAGFQLRPANAQDAFLQLADACGYPVAGEQCTAPSGVYTAVSLGALRSLGAHRD